MAEQRNHYHDPRFAIEKTQPEKWRGHDVPDDAVWLPYNEWRIQYGWRRATEEEVETEKTTAAHEAVTFLTGNDPNPPKNNGNNAKKRRDSQNAHKTGGSDQTLLFPPD
jgi:hypothetical protein